MEYEPMGFITDYYVRLFYLNIILIYFSRRDELYREAIQQSAKFNNKFINDRKTRIPLLDGQTRITQSNCTLWNIKYLRQKSTNQSQIYRYNVKKWVKKRRIIFDREGMVPSRQTPVNLNDTETDFEANVKPSPQNPVNDFKDWLDDSFDNADVNDNDFEFEKNTKRVIMIQIKNNRKKFFSLSFNFE